MSCEVIQAGHWLQDPSQCSLSLQSGQFNEDMIPTVGFNMRKITKGNVTIKVCWRACGGHRRVKGAQRDGRQGLKDIHLPLTLLPLLSALGHRGPTSFPQHVGTLLPRSERHCVSARLEVVVVVVGTCLGTQVGV